MKREQAKDMVVNAIFDNKVKELLLGRPGFCYLPKGSPSTGNTDLTAVMQLLCEAASSSNKTDISNSANAALFELVEQYEGLEPVATILFLESYYRRQNRPGLGIRANELAKKLSFSIDHFLPRLKEDKTEGGAIWPDGRVGELRRLNEITVKYGGPAFL